MATDVDVQYFSHLNGLTLGNNWGDLIRLLDTCLVNGLPLTSITAASIDAQGDIHLTTYADHKCMLFQIVELTGFAPVELNGKYRIKGVPSTTELILKAEHAGKSIATSGEAKLAPLGYEIIFRDTNDVKRVYRAKDPSAQHPFIRVDESLTSPDGTTGVYTSTYAKYAMVGLLEHMEHIDDYENPDVQQLPFDPADPIKNWKITGTGASVVRGWSRWYWATASQVSEPQVDSSNTYALNRQFTICGDKNSFYFLKNSYHYPGYPGNKKSLCGCGLFNQSTGSDNQWFLMTYLTTKNANQSVYQYLAVGGTPLVFDSAASKFFSTKDTYGAASHVVSTPILPDFFSGSSGIYNGNEVGLLEIPFFDTDKKLRGTLQHAAYSGKNHNITDTTPFYSEGSMYVIDNILANSSNSIGNLFFYLGEIE
ncbi:hypothetical protein [Acinetobacter lwoffii]|uniref:hypothetical protein n=1 Tax=Acinetobacter lwoffii TaxID=28090 RepID=UPI0032B54AC1